MFDEGVAAFVAETDRLDADGWSRPACGDWSATELARHVLSVIGWYHDWLDRAEAGDASPAFPVDDIDARTARSLAEVGDVPGPEATARFAEQAARYAERLEDGWDLPYGYPRGTVTAGLHAGIAASSGTPTRGTSHVSRTDHRAVRARPPLLAAARTACRRRDRRAPRGRAGAPVGRPARSGSGRR